MGSSNNSCPNYTNLKQRKHFPTMERTPRMLKDFLVDDSSNSFSSSGFKSFPRKPRNADSNSANAKKLIRSQSKAASTTISTIRSMINALKNIPFTAAVKSPSILPRSLSRRLTKNTRKKCDENSTESGVKITVTVKDIIRWRSFQDLVDEKSPPSDTAPSSPHQTVTTATGSTVTSPCSSNGSSWCDSDFTAEYLPSWSGKSETFSEEIDSGVGKSKNLFLPRVGEGSRETPLLRTSTAGPKEGKQKQKQQHSPISVIDLELEEDDDESTFSFDHDLASVERTKQKLLQRIRRFESLTRLDPFNLERAISMEGGSTCSGEDDDDFREELQEVREQKEWQLLKKVKAATSLGSSKNSSAVVDQMLLDFFREELAARNERGEGKNGQGNHECDDMVDRAKAWVNDEDSLCIDWEVEHKRQGYVRDMEREGKWSKFEAEQEEMALAIEKWVLGLLVDDLVLDLVLPW